MRKVIKTNRDSQVITTTLQRIKKSLRPMQTIYHQVDQTIMRRNTIWNQLNLMKMMTSC